MPVETSADRAEFFDLNDFAVECAITGPSFNATIPVLLNAMSDAITLYDTNIETPHHHFLCRAEDLAGLQRGLMKQYAATIAGVTYKIERITDDQDGNTLTVYLKK